MNIAFITREIDGLYNNGGIGTATRYICENLAAATDHEIHIYHTGKPQGDLDAFAAQMAEKRVAMHYIHDDANVFYISERRAYKVYETLKNSAHDVVFFHDYLADGAFCFFAKETGTAFNGRKLGLILHSPTRWCDHANRKFPQYPSRFSLYDREQACCELADFVISPSEYMLNWVRDEGWRLPRRALCIPNLVSPAGGTNTGAINEDPGRVAINELVFFGRLEERKGIRVFCDALSLLPSELIADTAVTFLGSPCGFNENAIREILPEFLFHPSRRVRFLSDLNAAEARKYLSETGRLAIMPSLEDNSPCVVHECLEDGIPFLASSSGGGSELIFSEDRDEATFVPDKRHLSRALTKLLSGDRKALVPRQEHPPQRRLEMWVSFLDELERDRAEEKPVSRRRDRPKVSIVLPHHDRPDLLKISLESCLKQDYPNLEIVLVDDGSVEAESVAYLDSLEKEHKDNRDFKIVRQENKYLGAARNRGVEVASGEYVVFLDDDNIALPDMVSRFVDAIEFGAADAVSGAMRFFYEQDGPPGVDAANNALMLFWGGHQRYSSMLYNHLGDATGIYRKETLQKAGGFHETFGVTHEDWKLYADIDRIGGKIICIPEMMFWYRITQGSMFRSTNEYMNALMHLDSYAKRLPPDMSHLPYVLFSMRKKAPSGNPTIMRLAYSLSDFIFKRPRLERLIYRIARYVDRKRKVVVK